MQRKKIPEKTKAEIRRLAKNRCGYCLSQQEYVWDILEIDHILPLAKGGKDDEENLWLICSTCNSSKYNKNRNFRFSNPTKYPAFQSTPTKLARTFQMEQRRNKNNRQNGNRSGNGYGFEFE